MKNPTTAFEVWEASLQGISSTGNTYSSDETSAQFLVNHLNIARRLLIVSSKYKFSSQIPQAVRSCISLVLYQYEINSLDDLIGMVAAKLGGTKVASIAFIAHGTESEIYLTVNKKRILSAETIFNNNPIRDFFCALVDNFLDRSADGARFDFLGCRLAQEEMGKLIIQELKKITKCKVDFSKDLPGSDTRVLQVINDVEQVLPVGALYFIPEKLKDVLYGPIESRSRSQSMAEYEKIRTVGKGAFGTAVLYRNKNDDSLVILKEINMHDLTAGERQLSMNEVRVLSMLHHPNIISYYDSFEEDGVLMIKMEYADGGTLQQYLSNLKTTLEENEILDLFKQIVSAICHMHEHNILHRDLKTANIFLTKDGLVKVGDFGISKMLTTRQGGANTVLGTPYYISPEMCEGKPYNEKSDIWALGCILYEMACLQKTFEGSNLPALVNKIVKGQFAPIRGHYSYDFKQLVRDLLQKHPEYRPTAREVLYDRLPELIEQFEPKRNDSDKDSEAVDKRKTDSRNTLRQPRSVLYRVQVNELDISLFPVPLPPKSRIKEVAVSFTHFIALTYDLMVYTWGEGKKGQLGHGTREPWLDKPKCIELLIEKSITKVCAGDGFSVFSSDNGIVMTCGDGSQGCLGYGDWNSSSKPKLVEKLLSVDVLSVSCGPHHVVVVGGEGDAYAWGCGSLGRLGTGSEEDCCFPTVVQLPENITVTKAFCGSDGTMFVTDTGMVLACGSNEYNKLGLSERRMFIMQVKQLMVKSEVDKWLIPTRVNCLRTKVVSISMGLTHTVVLLEPGKIITFGNNQDGQLGCGHTRNSLTPMLVKRMEDKCVMMVQCGSTFTVAGTIDNTVYFWGGRHVFSYPTVGMELDRHYQQDPLIDSLHTFHHKEKNRIPVIIDNDASEPNETFASEMNKIGQPQSPKEITSDKKDIILQPQEILALYASEAQVARGEIISLSDLYCSGTQLFLAVDTTVPLPRGNKKRGKGKKGQESETNYLKKINSYEDGVTLNSHVNYNAVMSVTSDSLGPTPAWLKEELAGPVIPGMTGSSVAEQKHRESSETKEKPFPLIQPVDVNVHRNSTGAAAKNNDISKLSSSRAESSRHSREVILKYEIQRLALEKKKTEEIVQELENSLSYQVIHKANFPTQVQEESLEKEITRIQKELEHQKQVFKDYQDRINKLEDQSKILEYQQNSPVKKSWSIPGIKSSNICCIQ
ncbi:serine/threonine-protein kinase Nek8-like [Limulus polyphemus]|uniref:non-specific serine/threonine protein kinase n=1 Tax=Limulus polyphemus TaxID=6850 RepID=A0ABM1T2N6_LIMPO|nr:serine/threonine-protein kinase Nek8-like [Limulus polyphemus]